MKKMRTLCKMLNTSERYIHHDPSLGPNAIDNISKIHDAPISTNSLKFIENLK